MGRLSTVDADGIPHVVPVCYVAESASIYSPIDEKPKNSSINELGRVRNIQQTGRATLLVDHYEEDWANLFWVQVRGTASIKRPEEAHHGEIISQLKDKYSQYKNQSLQDRPLIVLSVSTVVKWGKLQPEVL